MKIRAYFPLVLWAITATGCAPPRQKALQRLQKVGAEALRKEAALVYKDAFAAATPGLITIKPTKWPPNFKALAPLSVGAYRDGFALAMERGSERESGLYVIPLHMDVEPRASQRTRFERLAEGIYWYSFDL